MRSWLFLLALGACADPVIDMSLSMPAASQMPANFDVSCVSAVEVVAVGHERGSQSTPADALSDCVDLARAPTSLADIRAQIAGKFQLNLPQSGLAGISIRGTTGKCADKNRYYEANWYGGATYVDGQDGISIPVVPNISCNARKTYAVSTIDLLAISKTKQCAMAVPPAATLPLVFAGNIRPQMLGASFDRMVFEDGPSAVAPDAAGKAQIDSWTSAGPRACIAMGFDSGAGMAGSCINPSAPTLCGGPNEVELAMIDDIYAAASIDTSLVQQHGQPVFGAVWRQSPATTVTKAPIAGATVELEDPSQGTVVYVSPGTSKLQPIAGATSTGPDGMFIIYLKGDATNVIVKSGASQQRYTVASQGDLPPTLLAVLP